MHIELLFFSQSEVKSGIEVNAYEQGKAKKVASSVQFPGLSFWDCVEFACCHCLLVGKGWKIENGCIDGWMTTGTPQTENYLYTVEPSGLARVISDKSNPQLGVISIEML